MSHCTVHSGPDDLVWVGRMSDPLLLNNNLLVRRDRTMRGISCVVRNGSRGFTIACDTLMNHLMYPLVWAHSWLSGTWWPLYWWLRTCRANSMKAWAPSSAARSSMSVGALRIVWTYPYCLRFALASDWSSSRCRLWSIRSTSICFERAWCVVVSRTTSRWHENGPTNQWHLCSVQD